MASASSSPADDCAGIARSRRRGTVQIVERLAPGGIETLALDLLRSDTENGTILSLQGSVEELVHEWAPLAELRHRIVAFGRRPGVQPRLVTALAVCLRRLRPQAVIVHHLGPLLYGGLASKVAGVPRLIHVEHDAWHYDSRRQRRLGRWCARLLHPCVVAVSRQVADRVATVMPGIPIAVVPPGIPLDRFRPRDKAIARARLSLDLDWQVVGTVGRLVPLKGQRFLLEALAELPESVHIAIAGNGPERENLEALAHARGTAGRVHFLGHRDDLAEVYPAFDIFCLPSLSEGLPRTLLEAQACGVPVVATRVGGATEAVCPRTGALVDAGDPTAIASAARKLLNAASDVASPRSFVEARFSWTQTLQDYRDLVRG